MLAMSPAAKMVGSVMLCKVPVVRADATVTLALPKPGLLAAEGPGHVGDLYLADIAVPPEVYRWAGVEIGALFGGADVLSLLTTSAPSARSRPVHENGRARHAPDLGFMVAAWASTSTSISIRSVPSLG